MSRYKFGHYFEVYCNGVKRERIYDSMTSKQANSLIRLLELLEKLEIIDIFDFAEVETDA